MRDSNTYFFHEKYGIQFLKADRYCHPSGYRRPYFRGKRLKFFHFKQEPQTAVRLNLIIRGLKRKHLSSQSYVDASFFGWTRFNKPLRITSKKK